MSKKYRIGKDHPLYTGGKTLDANGYVVLCSKIWGNDCGRREHRVIMEKHVGRPLGRDEVVHHIDGNKANNVAAKLPNIGSYQCKGCAAGIGHNRTCKKCESSYIGGKNSRYCGGCVRKNNVH